MTGDRTTRELLILLVSRDERMFAWNRGDVHRRPDIKSYSDEEDRNVVGDVAGVLAERIDRKNTETP